MRCGCRPASSCSVACSHPQGVEPFQFTLARAAILVHMSACVEQLYSLSKTLQGRPSCILYCLAPEQAQLLQALHFDLTAETQGACCQLALPRLVSVELHLLGPYPVEGYTYTSGAEASIISMVGATLAWAMRCAVRKLLRKTQSRAKTVDV